MLKAVSSVRWLSAECRVLMSHIWCRSLENFNIHWSLTPANETQPAAASLTRRARSEYLFCQIKVHAHKRHKIVMSKNQDFTLSWLNLVMMLILVPVQDTEKRKLKTRGKNLINIKSLTFLPPSSIYLWAHFKGGKLIWTAHVLIPWAAPQTKLITIILTTKGLTLVLALQSPASSWSQTSETCDFLIYSLVPGEERRALSRDTAPRRGWPAQAAGPVYILSTVCEGLQ